jgi:hypothetical protein
MDLSGVLLWIWTASVLIGILVGVPILWQRYYLPLIPVCAALSAIAIGTIIGKVRKELDRIYRIKQD